MQRLPATASLRRRMPTRITKKELHLRRSPVVFFYPLNLFWFSLRVYQFEFLTMIQPFNPFLPSNGFCLGAEFFNVNKLFRSMHSRISSAFSFHVKLHSRVQIFSIPRVEIAALTQNDINIVGHPPSALHDRITITRSCSIGFPSSFLVILKNFSPANLVHP